MPCNKLYALEHRYERMSTEERNDASLEQSRPVSNELFKWAAETPAMPKSLPGKAMHYLPKQREYLENVYLDGKARTIEQPGRKKHKAARHWQKKLALLLHSKRRGSQIDNLLNNRGGQRKRAEALCIPETHIRNHARHPAGRLRKTPPMEPVVA